DLLAAQEAVVWLDQGLAAHAQVHAVETALIAHHELVAAVDEVGVAWAEPGVLRKHDLPVMPAGHVLGALQQIAQAVAPRVAADEDETRLAGRLHGTEVVRAQIQNLRRDHRAAATTELVP